MNLKTWVSHHPILTYIILTMTWSYGIWSFLFLFIISGELMKSAPPISFLFVVLVGTVTLDPTLKKRTRPPKYSRYIYPGSPGREIIRLMEFRGSLSYTFSKLRKDKALSFAN